MLVDSYDHDYLEKLGVTGLESGKTYKVGFTGVYSVDTTNGRDAGLDDEFEDNDTFANAKLITVGTDYGIYHGDADFFYFVMP